MTRERKEHKMDLQVCVGEKSILIVHSFELTNPKLLNSIPQEHVLLDD